MSQLGSPWIFTGIFCAAQEGTDSCLLPKQVGRCPPRNARPPCLKLPAGALPPFQPHSVLPTAPFRSPEPLPSDAGRRAESCWAFSASFVRPRCDQCSFLKYPGCETSSKAPSSPAQSTEQPAAGRDGDWCLHCPRLSSLHRGPHAATWSAPEQIQHRKTAAHGAQQCLLSAEQSRMLCCSTQSTASAAAAPGTRQKQKQGFGTAMFQQNVELQK